MFSRLISFRCILLATFLACLQGSCGFDIDSPTCNAPGLSTMKPLGNIQGLCTGACGSAEGIARCQLSGSILPPRLKAGKCTCKPSVEIIGNENYKCKRVGTTDCFDCTNSKIPVCTPNSNAKGNGY